MFLCRKVLHPWVSDKRLPIFVAAAVAATPITSKRAFALLAVTVLLHVCANSIGQRRLTVLKLEAKEMFLSRNGYKASSTRWS